MTDLRKAAEMALEALSFFGNNATNPAEEFITSKAINALRQALAQPANQSDCGHKEYRPFCQMCMATKQKPEQEPVTWRNAAIRLGEDLYSVGPDWYYDMTAKEWLDWALSVVTAPPSKPWVSLTDEERSDVIGDIFGNIFAAPQKSLSLARAIEAKLKEKNT